MIHLIGGAGFVGSRLAKILSMQGVAFKVFDKSLKGARFCDVTDANSMIRLPPADIVINLAAEHRDDVTPKSLYDAVNVDGARNVCDYCRNHNIQKIIFTSSVAVYGFAPDGTDERGAYNPFNDYGRTKMEAESIYRRWLAEAPTERSLVIVRPVVIFGEQNRGNVYNLLSKIAARRFIMFGPGNNRKSMAYVQNVAEFLAFCADFPPGEHLYNYADKPDLTMNLLVAHCRSFLQGKGGVGVRLPGWLGILIGYSFDIVALLTRKKLSISSLRAKKFMETTSFNTSVGDSGFLPSCTLHEGLERTLRYEFLEAHSGEQVFYSE